MRWQILIPTIPHRHAVLTELLGVLAAQMAPDVEVLIYHDNLEASYTEKLQALADAATADYTSHLADDDSVAPDFIPRILEAFTEDPDYVGFRVRYTEKGVEQLPVVHSLTGYGWYTTYTTIVRDLMYYNPIRRELAEEVRFRGRYCDMEWAEDLRKLGHVETQVFIDDQMLYYRHDSSNNFHTPRQPFPANEIPLPPMDYPFVRYIHP